VLLQTEFERNGNAQAMFATINGAAIAGIFNQLVGGGNGQPVSCALMKWFSLALLDNGTTA